MSRPITVVDLFCGAGGLGAGLRTAGLKTIHAVDSLPAAVRTYGMNFGEAARLETLRWDAELPSADVIVGGPPCQGFSSAGQRRLEDSRNSLVAVFAHLVARHRPSAFVFENVEGFLTGDDGRYLLEFLDTLVCAGYCMHLRKVNAAHYGVPQHRKRVIVVGGLGWDPGFPAFTHCAAGMPGAARVGRGLPRCPSVGEALRGLPAAERRLASKIPSSDHSFRVPGSADLVRYRALAPGETMKDLPEELWHPTFRRRAFRRVMDGTPSERRGGPPAGLRRLRGDQPSKAITSGAATEFVHPVEPRLLTLRECARLQTFPDDFRFRRYASRESAAHRQRRAALAWRSAGSAPQASVAGERCDQDASVAGPQIVCSNARDGDEPGAASIDLCRRIPRLSGGADVAPRVARPSPMQQGLEADCAAERDRLPWRCSSDRLRKGCRSPSARPAALV